MKFIKIICCGFFIVFYATDFARSKSFYPVRSAAMGGAGVALENISMPMRLNPGSMARGDEGRFSVFYSNIKGAQHLASTEYIHPFLLNSSLGAGAAVNYTNEENYELNYLFGAGVRPWRNLGVGISALALTEYISGEYTEDVDIHAGINCYPFPWLGVGIAGKNILSSSDVSNKVRTPDLLAGVSLINSDYLRVVSDFFFRDILEENGPRNIINKSGVEISVHDALKIRTGSEDGTWSMGLGVESKHIVFDYAYTPGESGIHFIEMGIKFGMSLSRREKEIVEKERQLEKDAFYLEALRNFNSGRMAAADRKVKEYRKKYGREKRIEKLAYDINQWLNKVRQEKMGRARELEQEILKAYYREQIEKAQVLMDNLKLIAPQYEEALYLEHLLNARVLLEEGRYEKAEDELVQALKINPESQEVRNLHNRLREVLKLED